MDDSTARTAVVIDDDPDVRDLLVQVLSSAGFEVIASGDGYAGVDAVIRHRPDITTVDVNMPGIDGFETTRRIREHSDTHIILITALTDEADAILGFSAGADDVITKPFRARELRARVLAAQRRRQVSEPRAGSDADRAPAGTAASSGSSSATVRPALRGRDGLEVRRDTHSVTLGGQPLTLTRTEFELLATLLEAAPEVRSKADLVAALRDDGAASTWVTDADERSIETHMTNLRRKLGDSVAEPRFIETLRAVGYRALRPEDPVRPTPPRG
ncbi:response regulator transcription factor [Microbacterium sp.]|uniref:response regulator transcription factor n=1 Tax=Microbacterium sp. TaxID=51671 RepID=UPI0039E282D9